MYLIYELLQTRNSTTKMEEPLRYYLSAEKAINTDCSEEELPTKTETEAVKSATDVFKGFLCLVIFNLNLKPQLLGKSCFILEFSAPSIPQRFHHQLNEFQLSRELIRSVICLGFFLLFPSLNKQEKCF